MTHEDEAGKVLLYIAIAVAAVIGLLIASAWVDEDAALHLTGG